MFGRCALKLYSSSGHKRLYCFNHTSVRQSVGDRITHYINNKGIIIKTTRVDHADYPKAIALFEDWKKYETQHQTEENRGPLPSALYHQMMVLYKEELGEPSRVLELFEEALQSGTRSCNFSSKRVLSFPSTIRYCERCSPERQKV